MALLQAVYHILSFLFLFPYGLYHLTLSTRSYFLSPLPHKSLPFHPFPFLPLRLLPLYLTLISLLISSLLSPFLLPSPFVALQFTLPLLLFTLLSLSLIFISLPSDFVFLLGSVSFLLLSFAASNGASSFPATDLQGKALSLSASISLLSALSALTLALSPRIFLAELTLAGSVSLHGLWSLQSALSLYIDSFIPTGCHTLIEKPGVTRCDVDQSRARAVQILDLAFVFHVSLIAVIVITVFGVTARVSGENGKRVGGNNNGGGNYEVLPTSSGVSDEHHAVQMKAIGKNTAQE